MILYHHDEALIEWASKRLDRPLGGPHRCAVGVVRDGELAAVVVWSEFRWPDIQASIVSSSPRWFTRAHIREILRYPFVQLRCKRVTAITWATNQRARAFLCRLGFRQEGFHPEAMPDGDAAVSYGLLARDAARWLTEECCSERRIFTTSCT